MATPGFWTMLSIYRSLSLLGRQRRIRRVEAHCTLPDGVQGHHDGERIGIVLPAGNGPAISNRFPLSQSLGP